MEVLEQEIPNQGRFLEMLKLGVIKTYLSDSRGVMRLEVFQVFRLFVYFGFGWGFETFLTNACQTWLSRVTKILGIIGFSRRVQFVIQFGHTPTLCA